VTDHYEVIMTALHERRNRLIALDMEAKVNATSVPKLRERINEVTNAIQSLKRVGGKLNTGSHL
jgi:hypothetical protein